MSRYWLLSTLASNSSPARITIADNDQKPLYLAIQLILGAVKTLIMGKRLPFCEPVIGNMCLKPQSLSIKMAAVANVDVVRTWFEAHARGDMETVLALTHPEIEVRPALVGGLEGRVYRGRDGVREFLDEVDSIWTDFRVELRELRDAGDVVIVLGHTWAEGRDGIALDDPGGWLIGMSDGMVRDFRSFTSG